MCRWCGGGAALCSARLDNPMRCPSPVYDDEDDLIGVCPHLTPCPNCRPMMPGKHPAE